MNVVLPLRTADNDALRSSLCTTAALAQAAAATRSCGLCWILATTCRRTSPVLPLAAAPASPAAVRINSHLMPVRLLPPGATAAAAAPARVGSAGASPQPAGGPRVSAAAAVAASPAPAPAPAQAASAPAQPAAAALSAAVAPAASAPPAQLLALLPPLLPNLPDKPLLLLLLPPRRLQLPPPLRLWRLLLLPRSRWPLLASRECCAKEEIDATPCACQACASFMEPPLLILKISRRTSSVGRASVS